jgi:DNA polymerase III gamma/tau subunit
LYTAFVKAGELVDSGKDVKQTLIALQAHLRDLLVAGVANSPQALADVSPDRFAQLKEESGWFAPAQLLRMLDILAESERSLRFTNQHHRVLEMALWNILPRHINAVNAVNAVNAIQAAPVPTPTTAAPRAASPTAAPAARPAPPAPPVPAAPPGPPAQASEGQRAAPVPAAAEEPSEDSAEKTSWGAEIDLDGIRRIWPRVIKKVLQRSPSAKAIFGGEQVLRLENHVVHIGFPSEFILSRADRPKGREMLESVLAEELGIRGWKIRCSLLEESAPYVAAPPAEAIPLAMLADQDDHAIAPPANGYRAGNDSPREAVVSPAAVAPQPAAGGEGEQFLKLVLEEFDGQIVDD